MNRYPTEEELDRMIEELEQGQLYAPRHLKADILRKVKETEKDGSKGAQPVSFLMYSLKMAVGMAAAVLLVFMIPAGSGSSVCSAGIIDRQRDVREERETVEDTGRISLDEKITAHMDEKREEAGRLFEDVGNLFRRDDLGGDDYES